VIWIAAGRHVTSMTNTKAVRDRTKELFPGKAMGFDGFSFSSANPDVAIAVTVK
jgi:hypothetical protein